MSRKYEHRIESLKEHKTDKERRLHKTKNRKKYKDHNANSEKKAQDDFRKKINKSKHIW